MYQPAAEDHELRCSTFNVRFGRDSSIVLGPIQRDAATVLHIGRIIWIGEQLRPWSMEGRCKHLRYNLLRFDIIGDIALSGRGQRLQQC